MEFSTYRDQFKQILDRIDEGEVSQLTDLLAQARAEGRYVFIAGNGGSAANASHLCEDMAKGTLSDFESQPRLKIMSLTDNVPAILAWANDEGYERIFVEQLRTYAAPGDVLIAISGSGNSSNVLAAVDWANRHGLRTVGVTGYDGGELRARAAHRLHVPVEDMGAAEAAHDVVFHYLVHTLQRRFAREDGIATNTAP
jgi:D-sedoheptulose 7-phosphate isomerase